jgi:hypothetical protein
MMSDVLFDASSGFEDALFSYTAAYPPIRPYIVGVMRVAKALRVYLDTCPLRDEEEDLALAKLNRALRRPLLTGKAVPMPHRPDLANDSLSRLLVKVVSEIEYYQSPEWDEHWYESLSPQIEGIKRAMNALRVFLDSRPPPEGAEDTALAELQSVFRKPCLAEPDMAAEASLSGVEGKPGCAGVPAKILSKRAKTAAGQGKG